MPTSVALNSGNEFFRDYVGNFVKNRAGGGSNLEGMISGGAISIPIPGVREKDRGYDAVFPDGRESVSAGVKTKGPQLRQSLLLRIGATMMGLGALFTLVTLPLPHIKDYICGTRNFMSHSPAFCAASNGARMPLPLDGRILEGQNSGEMFYVDTLKRETVPVGIRQGVNLFRHNLFHSVNENPGEVDILNQGEYFITNVTIPNGTKKSTFYLNGVPFLNYEAGHGQKLFGEGANYSPQWDYHLGDLEFDELIDDAVKKNSLGRKSPLSVFRICPRRLPDNSIHSKAKRPVDCLQIYGDSSSLRPGFHNFSVRYLDEEGREKKIKRLMYLRPGGDMNPADRVLAEKHMRIARRDIERLYVRK